MGILTLKPETKKEVALKWVTIPLTMILIMIAGAPINIHKHYKENKNPYSEIVRGASLVGQYLVIIPGFLYKRNAQRRVMELSSILLAISYFYLGSLEMYKTGMIGLDTSLLALGGFLANLSSTLIIFTAISLCISNFPHEANLMLPIIIAAHLVTAGEFDENLKNLLFGTIENLKLSTFLYITGGYVGFISLLLSLVIKRRVIKSLLVSWFTPDNFGVTIFVLYSALFIEILIASQIVQENYAMTVGVFIIGALVYLYIPYFFRRIIQDQAVKLKGLKMTKVVREVSLSKGLKDSKFVLMCVVSSVVKGTSLTTIHYIKDIGVFFRRFHEVEHMQKSLWIMTVTAVFGGGILVIFFRKSLHAYFFLGFAPFLGIFGFYYFLGVGYGLISVIVPQIILFGGGQANFIRTWGFVYFGDLIGIVLFDLVMKGILLWENQYNLFIYFGIGAFLNLILFIIGVKKYCQRKLKKKEIKAEKKAIKIKEKKLKLKRKKDKLKNNSKKSDKNTLQKKKTKRRDSFNALDLELSPKLKI